MDYQLIPCPFQAIIAFVILVFLEHGSLGFLRRLERKKTGAMLTTTEEETDKVRRRGEGGVRYELELEEK